MKQIVDFLKETFEHSKNYSYVQFGLFVLVVIIIFIIEHLTHYNTMLYGLAPNPYAPSPSASNTEIKSIGTAKHKKSKSK